MTDIVFVPVGGGVVVPHTPAEYARFMRGVDVEASWLVYDGTAPCDTYVMGPGNPDKE